MLLYRFHLIIVEEIIVKKGTQLLILICVLFLYFFFPNILFFIALIDFCLFLFWNDDFIASFTHLPFFPSSFFLLFLSCGLFPLFSASISSSPALPS